MPKSATPWIPADAIARRISLMPNEPQEWLWPGRVPVGALTLITGEPGVGKSMLGLEIAARVTTGQAWPDGRPGTGKPQEVIYCGGEDDLFCTVRPRLEACGADLGRIYSLQHIRDDQHGDDQLFRIKTHHDSLMRAIGELGAALVLIDPMWTHLPSGGSAGEIRETMAHLNYMSQRTAVAFILITHLTKQTTASAMYRSSGSLALIAASRCAHLVTRDVDSPSDRRLFLPVKNNLTAPVPGLGFSVGSGKIEWDAAPVVAESAAVAVSAAPRPTDLRAAERQEAMELVANLLANGPLPSAEVFEAASARALPRSVMRRAAHTLHVNFSKEGKNGKWFWALSAGAAAIEDVDAAKAQVQV